ncbi:hypothetical protein D3C72_1689550 [compost metagenome]
MVGLGQRVWAGGAVEQFDELGQDALAGGLGDQGRELFDPGVGGVLHPPGQGRGEPVDPEQPERVVFEVPARDGADALKLHVFQAACRIDELARVEPQRERVEGQVAAAQIHVERVALLAREVHRDAASQGRAHHAELGVEGHDRPRPALQERFRQGRRVTGHHHVPVEGLAAQ